MTTTKSRAKKPANANPVRPGPQPKNKKDAVIALLRRVGGASLSEITDESGWLPHTARAALTGLRKAGYTIEKDKADGVTRWSITAQPA